MAPEMFAARLRELRIQAGLSQAALAARVGVTVRQISRLETAAQVPTWPTILALCAALGVECMAFTQAPASEGKPGRGRPPKDDGGPGTEPPAAKGSKGKARREDGKKGKE